MALQELIINKDFDNIIKHFITSSNLGDNLDDQIIDVKLNDIETINKFIISDQNYSQDFIEYFNKNIISGDIMKLVTLGTFFHETRNMDLVDKCSDKIINILVDFFESQENNEYLTKIVTDKNVDEMFNVIAYFDRIGNPDAVTLCTRIITEMTTDETEIEATNVNDFNLNLNLTLPK